MTQCIGTASSGEPCPAPATEESEYCLFHDPARIDKARAARLAGGFARKLPESGEYPGEIKGIDDVLKWLNCTLADTWKQQNSDKRSKSLSSLLRIAIETLEGSDVDKRLTQLEELIYANNKKTN